MIPLPTKQKLEFFRLLKIYQKNYTQRYKKIQTKETINVLFDTIKPRIIIYKDIYNIIKLTITKNLSDLHN